MPKYCPLCSALMGDDPVETCAKCGCDVRAEKERKDRYNAALKRKSETVQGPFHPVTGRKCPVCGEDVEILSPAVEEFMVYGEKCGKGPTGDMMAPTQIFIGFQAWRCRRSHRLFSNYETESRMLCPSCMIPNNRYGNLVRSCPKCQTMVPVEYYREENPLELMKKRGYHFAPDLE